MIQQRKKNKIEQPDIKAFCLFLEEICRQKSLKMEEIEESVKYSLITAYEKKYGLDIKVRIILNALERQLEIHRFYKVVTEVENKDLEKSLEQAREINPDVKIGEEVETIENPFEISRMSAANIRQNFMQKLRELERNIIYNEFKAKEGQLINGYFLRWRDKDTMYIDLGKKEAILPRREQIPGERFRATDRVKALIKSVELRNENTNDPGPFIIVSRSSPDFVKALFELEIPEIYEGLVEIVDIARVAGYRSKILVSAVRDNIDPVGACVGIRGVRIQSIIRDLGSERIDIINQKHPIATIIANALSPAKVLETKVSTSKKEALIIVDDATYSSAIGLNGQNVRLASQLTGYQLLVKSYSLFNSEVASPESRAHLEQIFTDVPQKEDTQDDSIPLIELDLAPRIIDILKEAKIESVNQLIEMSQDELECIPGVGKNTAKQIFNILSETIEFEDG